MRGYLMLCDFAEEIGGKLYIMGGGWSRTSRADQPGDFNLAGKVLVPWTSANRPHELRVALLTEDGEPVLNDEEPVALVGKVEVGRPAGLAEGTDLDLPFAFRIQGLVLPQGRYRWELTMDGEPTAEAAFEMLPVPAVFLRPT